jgi:RNA polymerase sigma-70 factor (ECF subfamily)
MNVAASDESAPVTEAEWVARCRAGDAAAWRWLYDKHFPVVYRLALRMGAAPREAQDICQEVFLRVYRKLGSFRGEAALGTWIFRIAMNEVSRVRREGAVRRALGALIGREPDPEPARAPDEPLYRAEAFRELQAVLARMKPKQRSVFVLYELEELSTEEIAQVLGCPVETIKSRLRHARADFERLRRQRTLVAIDGGRR